MRVLPVLLLVLAATVASGGDSGCFCPAGFRHVHKDGCYHLVADGSFEAVQVACQSRGGQLISINRELLNTFSRSVMAINRRAMVWIGLRDVSKEEAQLAEPDWRWSDGSPLSYDDWHREAGSGHCVVHWLHGGWQRKDCSQPAPGLCYRARGQHRACPGPAAPLKARLQDILGMKSRLAGGAANRQLVPPPPPALRARPPLGPQRLRNHRRMVLRDAPIVWHHWL